MRRTLEFVIHKDRDTKLTTEEWRFVQKSVEGRINRRTLDVWYDIPDLCVQVARHGFECYYACLKAHNALPKKYYAFARSLALPV